MIFDIEIAKQVAKSLLQIKGIILQPNNPFVWASGWLSPIYCDWVIGRRAKVKIVANQLIAREMFE